MKPIMVGQDRDHVGDSPGLNNREWIETGVQSRTHCDHRDSPGLNNREWIETGRSMMQPSTWGYSPGLNNREWIETQAHAT